MVLRCPWWLRRRRGFCVLLLVTCIVTTRYLNWFALDRTHSTLGPTGLGHAEGTGGPLAATPSAVGAAQTLPTAGPRNENTGLAQSNLDMTDDEASQFSMCGRSEPPISPIATNVHGMLHVIQFNVLNGAHDLVRRHRLCEWLRTQQADVVTLNELNFWDEVSLKTWAKSCGYADAALLETRSSYRVGAMSRSEPVVVVGRHVEGFGHGALHFIVRGWHFFVTHLTPLGGDAGMAEVKVLLDLVNKSVPAGAPLLILGDLNALSPNDADVYDKHHLATTLDKKKINTGKSKHGLAAKFLTDGGKAVNYAMIQRFIDAGFTDLQPLASVGAPPWQLPKLSANVEQEYGGVYWPRNTVPTSMHADAMHAAPMRLDYALANSAAVARMKLAPSSAPAAHAGVVQDPVTDTLSDHYPLEVFACDFQSNGANGACDTSKIAAALRQRVELERTMPCEEKVWETAWERTRNNLQTSALQQMSKRHVLGLWSSPDMLTEPGATIYIRGGAGETCTAACSRHGAALAGPPPQQAPSSNADVRTHKLTGQPVMQAGTVTTVKLFGQEIQVRSLPNGAIERVPRRSLDGEMPTREASPDYKVGAQTDQLYCHDSICLNGGTCYEIFTKPICHCPDGWGGIHCEAAGGDRNSIARAIEQGGYPSESTEDPDLAPTVPEAKVIWQCDAEDTMAAAKDCELLTAIFGCKNGCFPIPNDHPYFPGQAAPYWTDNMDSMLPDVCVLPGNKTDGSVQSEYDTGSSIGDCEFSTRIVGGFLPGCYNGCKAHATLEDAQLFCATQLGCGGVTYSNDTTADGSEGFQTRAGTHVETGPDPLEQSWVKLKCLHGGGIADVCGQSDVQRGQRLCACSVHAV